MANAMYNFARETAAQGGLGWTTNDWRVALIAISGTGSYTYAATHKFLTDVAATAFLAPTSGTRAGTSLGTKDATDGACDAADVTFSSVTNSLNGGAIIIFKWVTDATDSWLGVYIDTATGLPITPNGGNIIVQWDNGTNKIFRP